MISIEHRVDGYVIVKNEGINSFGRTHLYEYNGGTWYSVFGGTHYRWLWLAKLIAKRVIKREDRMRLALARRTSHINRTVWSSEEKDIDLV
jgi:glutathionylspermidine synthase